MKVVVLGTAENHHIHRWCTWLAAQGLTVTLLSDKPPRPAMDYKGVTIRGPEWNFWRNLYAFKIRGGPYANNIHKWRAYRRIIEEERPDVIHAHDALVNGPTLAHFPKNPRVLTPWGPDVELLERGPKEKQRLVRHAVKSADIIVTNAPGMEERWSRLMGVSRDRLRLFSWGIDTHIFQPRTEPEKLTIRAELGVSSLRPIMLSPRLAKPYYHIDTIMRAWQAARQGAVEGSTLAEAYLVILRAGADESSWAALVKQAKEMRNPSIRLMDVRLSPAQMAAIYSTSAGVVMIPETDLLSMSLLESIACGCIPVLLPQPCNQSAVEEISEHPRKAVGIYAASAEEKDVAQAFRKWGEIPAAQRPMLAEHNVEYAAKNQSWDVCAKGMLEAYEAARARAVDL
ncbi:hypothetical protein BH09SUM1_BH09SUM1_26310 [soil metagenome]